MEDKWNVDVDIPEDLEEVIHRGLQDGKAAAARRRRARRLAGRSLCCVVLVVAVFAGGVHLSPAFAAAIREIPVIGHLVRVFFNVAGDHPLALGKACTVLADALGKLAVHVLPSFPEWPLSSWDQSTLYLIHFKAFPCKKQENSLVFRRYCPGFAGIIPKISKQPGIKKAGTQPADLSFPFQHLAQLGMKPV